MLQNHPGKTNLANPNPNQLTTTSVVSPLFYMFLASQITAGEKGFLSRDISVREMVEHRGDYNHIANFIFMQSKINIQIGSKAPVHYLGELLRQCDTGEAHYGNITNRRTLHTRTGLYH